MTGHIQREISTALDEAGTKSSADIVKALSLGAKEQLATERFDRMRRTRRHGARLVDEEKQLPLPGFEHLHAYYPNTDGILTKLDDLSPAECRANAARVRAEAAEHAVPRYKESGKYKELEAAELEKWAALIESQEGKRA